MDKKKWILVGVGVLALGLVLALVPASESYSNRGLWSDEGAVDVKCGSLFAREVNADFADWQEQQDYDRDVNWYGEPSIFEGQTATQVCDDKLGGIRAAVVLLIIGGLLALGIGLTRKPPVWNDGTSPVAGGAGPPAPLAPPGARQPAPTAAPAPPADQPAEPPSDQTVRREAIPQPEGPRPKSYKVLFDNGEVAELESPLVIGRDPALCGDAPGARLHVLVDQTRTISKTHLTLIPEGDLVWVVDRNSTNGTVVVDEGDESPVEPGVRTPAAPGRIIKFGDRTLTIIGGG